jgi:4-hydroxy-tetrahydrodipicolinate synthase
LDIDGFLTVTPYYVKPSQQGLIEHYMAIADAAEHPVYLYNVPGRTGCDLKNSSVLALSEHPNIYGIKDATGDLSRGKELIAQVSGQFAVLSGDDATAQTFMELGGDGVISVTANLVPKAMADRCRYTEKGELEQARSIEQQIQALHQLLFVEANPIPVKWALSQMNKITNTLRLPLTPLEQGKEPLLTALRQLALVG